MKLLLLCLFLIQYLFVFAQADLNSVNDRGIELVDQLQYQQAEQVFKNGLERSISEDRPEFEAMFLSGLGFLYNKEKQYKLAIDYYSKSLVIAERIHNKKIGSNVHLNLGQIYQEQGLHENAMSQLLMSVSYFEETADTASLASCLNTIGNIQNDLNNFKLALGYYRSALKLRLAAKNMAGIAGSYNNIGDLFKKHTLYDSAIYYLRQAIYYKQVIGDTAFLSSSVATLGETFHLKGDYKQALEYYLKAYIFRKLMRNESGIARSANRLGAIYLDTKRYDLVEEYLKEARNIALAKDMKSLLLENYDLTRKFYRYRRNWDLALKYDDEYIALKDTLLDEQKNKALAEMEIKYETDKKDGELLFLVQERQLQTTKYYFVISALLVISLIVVILIFSNYQRRKAKERIEILLKELNHRTKNNLQILIGLLTIQLEQSDNQFAKGAVNSTIERVNAMLLIHHRLYKNKDVANIDMVDFLKKLTADLQMSYGFSSENLDLQLDLAPCTLEVDIAIPLGLILNELISNAFKHAFNNQSSPVLSIRIQCVGKAFKATIHDNGPGFDLMSHTQSYGLKIVELLVKQIDARIQIQHNEGTKIELEMNL